MANWRDLGFEKGKCWIESEEVVELDQSGLQELRNLLFYFGLLGIGVAVRSDIHGV